ncbi:activating transcription factor 7-interacting protein 1-like isoform X2 [Branchiostoma floridae]|uniref:Activating transcription factor 7-interacting protein 1-like isoform X2 n=1 Tax=Branchiostoma floridae TaxID=7739 RepID=A0A9J7M730_BRAFL|nr:activating transcription factor 7-interacting protein 1-like isoform X2 [Branchiostoma floridae]
MLKGRKGGNRKSRRKGPRDDEKLKGAASSKEVAKKETQCKPCRVILTDILKERPELKTMSTDARTAMEGASRSLSVSSQPVKRQVAKKSTSKPAGFQAKLNSTHSSREPPKKTPRLEASPEFAVLKKTSGSKESTVTSDSASRNSSERVDKQSSGSLSNHSKSHQVSKDASLQQKDLPVVAKKSTHSIKRKIAQKEAQQNGEKQRSHTTNSVKSSVSSKSAHQADSVKSSVSSKTAHQVESNSIKPVMLPSAPSTCNASSTSTRDTKAQSSTTTTVNGQKSKRKCSSLRSVRVFDDDSTGDISISNELMTSSLDHSVRAESKKDTVDKPMKLSSDKASSTPSHKKAVHSDKTLQSTTTNGKKEDTRSKVQHVKSDDKVARLKNASESSNTSMSGATDPLRGKESITRVKEATDEKPLNSIPNKVPKMVTQNIADQHPKKESQLSTTSDAPDQKKPLATKAKLASTVNQQVSTPKKEIAPKNEISPKEELSSKQDILSKQVISMKQDIFSKEHVSSNEAVPPKEEVSTKQEDHLKEEIPPKQEVPPKEENFPQTDHLSTPAKEMLSLGDHATKPMYQSISSTGSASTTSSHRMPTATEKESEPAGHVEASAIQAVSATYPAPVPEQVAASTCQIPVAPPTTAKDCSAQQLASISQVEPTTDVSSVSLQPVAATGSLVSLPVVTPTGQVSVTADQAMATANQVSVPEVASAPASNVELPGSDRQSVQDASAKAAAVSAPLQSTPAEQKVTTVSEVSTVTQQAPPSATVAYSSTQQMSVDTSASPAMPLSGSVKEMPVVTESRENRSPVQHVSAPEPVKQPSAPAQKEAASSSHVPGPPKHTLSPVNQTLPPGSKVPSSSSSKEVPSQAQQHQSNPTTTTTKGTSDLHKSRSPPPLIPVQNTSLPVPFATAKGTNKTGAANNPTEPTSRPGAEGNDIVVVEDTPESQPQDSSNSGKSSPPNRPSSSSSPPMAASDAVSNPPKSRTPPANGTETAASDEQQTQANSDAEPIVIDDNPSTEDQPSVQQDQGMSVGKKREGEPNPGHGAKKPRLDNGATQGFVNRTVATDAADSCSAQFARHIPASVPVTRTVGCNTTCAAQRQQLLGREDLKKMVEDKVAHCTAKANSQMKQFQDRVAKLTKVCKGWEEYARKLQKKRKRMKKLIKELTQKLVTMNQEQDRLKRELKRRRAIGGPRPVDVGVQADLKPQQPTAQASSSQTSSGPTSGGPTSSGPSSTSAPAPKPTVTPVATRQQAVPRPPPPTYTRPPQVQRVPTATESVSVTSSAVQRAGPPQPQVATAPKAPPPQPTSQPQAISSQRTTPTGVPHPPRNIPTLVHHPPPPPPPRTSRTSPTLYNNSSLNSQPPYRQPTQAAPPTRQKTPEKARVPSQDAGKINAVIDLTEDAEETQASAQGRKPSGAGPPPLLKAVATPSAAPNTVAPTSQARPTSQVRPFNNPQPVPVAISTSNSNARNITNVVQAIVNSTRAIQAPPNFRPVATTVQQVGQNPMHSMPPTAPAYQRPPVQVLAQIPQSTVGYVGQPVMPRVQTAGTFRPPAVTTSAFVGQPAHVVESVLSPPVMCMQPSQQGNPLYNHYTQPQRHPVPNVVVQARHPMPQTVQAYRQAFHQVQPPANMMQGPRPAGPAVVPRPAPPPLLHSNNPPQVQQMRPPMQPTFPQRPPAMQQPPQPPQPANHPHPGNNQHPAPLPQPPPPSPQLPPQYANLPLPHRTTLHIARAGNGIVLSWNVTEPPNPHAPTVDCYQLFAYQEGTGQPNTALWKKIGDVKALPLPMACTLTQFLPGSTYHFAVRAMDVYQRVGPFSAPCSIDLSSS